jgi:hypothetical protein
MGMKKISASNEQEILRTIRTWPLAKRLTWETLRAFLAEQQAASQGVWSRQSLSANTKVQDAFNSFKLRQTQSRTRTAPQSEDAKDCRIGELEAELRELQIRFDRLLLRHTQLAYNASLLDGGTQLLDSLPDNTRSQTG